MSSGSANVPNRPSSELPQTAAGFVQKQLGRTQAYLKFVDFITSLLLLVTLVLGTLFVLAVVDAWIIGLNRFTRWIVFLGLVGGSATFLARALMPLLLKRINPLYAAQVIEKSQPGFKNSVLNFLTLGMTHERRKRSKIEKAVIDAVEFRAAADLGRTPVESTIDLSRLIWIGYVLIGIMVLGGIYKVRSPKDPFQTVVRIVAPMADVERPAKVRIVSVLPGDEEIFYGEVVPVEVKVKGLSSDDEVMLRFSTLDGRIVDRAVALTALDETGKRYGVDLSTGATGVQQSLRYRIEAGDATSSEYRIEVHAKPTMVVEQLELRYPEYTRLPTRRLEGASDVRGLEGTMVRIEASANLPIERAAIELMGEYSSDQNAKPAADGERPDRQQGSANRRVATTINMKVAEGRAQGEFRLLFDASGKRPRYTHFRLRFTSTGGDRNENPDEFQIQVIPDLAPEIFVRQPEAREVELPVDRSLRMVFDAYDPDFLVTSVKLVTKQGERTLAQAEMLPSDDEPKPRVVAEGRWYPDDFALSPGDQVVVTGVVEDNRQAPTSGLFEPNRTESASIAIRIIDPVGGVDPLDAMPEPEADRSPAENGSAPGDSQPQSPDTNSSQDQIDSEQQNAASPSGNDDGDAGTADAGTSGQDSSESASAESGTDASNNAQDSDSAGSEAGEQETGEPSDTGNREPNRENQTEAAEGTESGTGEQDSTGSGSESSGGASESEAGGTSQSEGASGAESSNASSSSDARPGDGTGQDTSGSADSNASSGADLGSNGRASEHSGGAESANPSTGEGGQPSNQEGQPPVHEGEVFDQVRKYLEEQAANTSHGRESGGQESGGQESGGQESGGQESGGQESGGQESGGQESGGQESGGQESGGQESGGQESGGQESGGQESGGQESGGQESGGQESGGQESGGQESGGQESGGQESGGQESGGQESGGQESGGQESGGQESGGQESGGQESGGQESGGQESGGHESGGQESGGQESGGQESGGQESGGQESGGQSPEGVNESGGENRLQSGGPQSGATGDSGASGSESDQGPQGGRQGREGNNAGDSSGSSSPDGGGSSQNSQGSPSDPNATGNEPSGENQPRQSQDSPTSSGAQSGRQAGNRANDGMNSDSDAGDSARDEEASRDQPNPTDDESSSTESGRSGDTGNSNSNLGSRSQDSGASSSGSPSGDSRGAPDRRGVDRSEDPFVPTELPEGDEANLEYAREATDLVLEYLKDQKDSPDAELLRRLNWTPEELNQFVEQWTEMKNQANQGDDGARRQLDDRLRSLGLRSERDRDLATRARSDEVQQLQQGGQRSQPPAEYAEMFRAFLQGTARSEPPRK